MIEELDEKLIPYIQYLPKRYQEAIKLRYGMGCDKHSFRKIGEKILSLQTGKALSIERVRQMVYKSIRWLNNKYELRNFIPDDSQYPVDKFDIRKMTKNFLKGNNVHSLYDLIYLYKKSTFNNLEDFIRSLNNIGPNLTKEIMEFLHHIKINMDDLK
jgi:hypothetical protein